MAAQQYETVETPPSKIPSKDTPAARSEIYDDITVAPIEAHTATGPTLLLEQAGHASDHDDRSTLVFKRLRRDMTPAGPWLFAAMT